MGKPMGLVSGGVAFIRRRILRGVRWCVKHRMGRVYDRDPWWARASLRRGDRAP